MIKKNNKMSKESFEQTENLLGRLLNRPAFAWEKESLTIGQAISAAARQEAGERIAEINRNLDVSPSLVLEKLIPRANSWQYGKWLKPYSAQTERNVPLEAFLEYATQKEKRVEIILAKLPLTQAAPKNLVGKQWVAQALAYETRAAIRRQTEAKDKKGKLKEEVILSETRKLKQAPDSQYGDQFNRLVSTKLDELEAAGKTAPQGQPKLAWAQELIEKEIAAGINDEKLKDYLFDKIRGQKRKRIQNLLAVGLNLLKDPEKAIAFAALMFEIDQRKTDGIWQQPKFEQIITSALNGEPVNLISMLCCINQFDLNGGYTLVPDLFAYQQNPKLEPVPLIVEELTLVKRFFESYGLKTDLTILVSDTDYTEIGQFGKVIPENVANLRQYLLNLQEFIATNDPQVKIIPISTLTSNSPLYQEVKERVLTNVAKFKDQDFAREWYQRFEQAAEQVYESQLKRRLFPIGEMRENAFAITRMIWAVNAAQGAVFGTLDSNTILISTERRERDTNYVIDKATRKNFPPVVYLLRAAEMWNRKLTGKTD